MALDLMAALRELVLQDVTIMGILADSDGEGIPPAAERVFVNAIPRAVIEAADTFHPPKMLVLRMAGGVGKSDRTVLDEPTITALCYGESDLEADRIRRALWSRFVKLQRECHLDVLIHHVNPTGGPIPLVDPDIVWPAMSQSFQLTADVEEAA